MRGFSICKKSGLNSGAWTVEENAKLSQYIERYGIGNWGKLPEYAGLKRCGKSCRLRWLNYLQPGLKRGKFSQEEEELIVNLHQKLGNSWSKIAANLQGRSDNEVKNYWHTHLKDRSKNNTSRKGVKKKPKSESKSLYKEHIASFGSFVLESSSSGLLPQQNSEGFSLSIGNEIIVAEERIPEEGEKDIWSKMLELESMLEIIESLPRVDDDDDDHVIITTEIVQKLGFKSEQSEEYITTVLNSPESPKSPNNISPLTVGNKVVLMEKTITNGFAALRQFNLDLE